MGVWRGESEGVGGRGVKCGRCEIVDGAAMPTCLFMEIQMHDYFCSYMYTDQQQLAFRTGGKQLVNQD